MIDLQPLVRSYLQSSDFKILSEHSNCIIADKLVFGHDRDTYVVWTVPIGREPNRFESTLRASISEIRPNYLEAKAYVISYSKAGFSRDLIQELADARIRFLVPIQFFDAPFKVEDAPKAVSAIADIRDLAANQKRVPQPFRVIDNDNNFAEEDLLNYLKNELIDIKFPVVRIIVGRAGIGKSFLFRALFKKLYDSFLDAKLRLIEKPRPIPFLPEHRKGLFALRAEALVDSFLRTDVASPITRQNFEWLLVNGFATWLLDGLDELYAGDPSFFEYISDLITRKDSKAQITIFCRDSLLTTSDSFSDFRNLCAGTNNIKVYKLSDWDRPSKRHFAWLHYEDKSPELNETDTPKVASFLNEIDTNPTLKSISGLPFYCQLLLDAHREGHIKKFNDDVALVNHVVDQMINREIKKGLLDLNYFDKGGLQEWLEQIAINFIDGNNYGEIDRDEAEEYGQLVLSANIDDDIKRHLLTTLLQFPLFRAGTKTGSITFSHELIALALAARAYCRKILAQPSDVAQRLSKIDLEDPVILRFMSKILNNDGLTAITNALQSSTIHGREAAIFITLAMLYSPDHSLVQRIKRNFDAYDLVNVHFVKRDLSKISFRNADLSYTLFKECNLKETRFEGAFFNHTRFESNNEFEGAYFGDISRIDSIFVGNRMLENTDQIRNWISEVTGRSADHSELCATALQFCHIFQKFISPLGLPKRDSLTSSALIAGKRFRGSASTEACVEEIVKEGYLSKPDFRGRLRRCDGDKYAEMVQFVTNRSISNGIGKIIARLCTKRGCLHQLHN